MSALRSELGAVFLGDPCFQMKWRAPRQGKLRLLDGAVSHIRSTALAERDHLASKLLAGNQLLSKPVEKRILFTAHLSFLLI